MSVHGDDNWISSERKIDIDKINTCVRSFGFEISIDKCHSADPHENRVHFLGSLWVDGKPERPVEKMVLSASTARGGRWPEIGGADNIIDGRVYTVFGYDHRLEEFWEKLGREPFLGRKIFVFSEGLSWEAKTRAKDTSSGMWIVGRRDEWARR
jgi:hypothetical protein